MSIEKGATGTAVGLLDQIHPMLLVPNPYDTARVIGPVPLDLLGHHLGRAPYGPGYPRYPVSPVQAPLYRQLVVVRECSPDTLLPFSHGSLLSSRAFCPWKRKAPFRGRESRRAIACKRLPNWDLATWLLYIVNILPVSIYGGNIPIGFARNMYLP